MTYHPDGPEGQAYEIDFTPPFKRVSMTHDLEKIMGVKFPPTDSYDSDGKKCRDGLHVRKGLCALSNICQALIWTFHWATCISIYVSVH